MTFVNMFEKKCSNSFVVVIVVVVICVKIRHKKSATLRKKNSFRHRFMSYRERQMLSCDLKLKSAVAKTWSAECRVIVD